jgi:hypothetical protein
MFGNEPTFKVDYQVDGNTLYRRTAKTIECIVPWGSDAGAWQTSAGTCSPFVPEIDLSLIEQIAWQPGGSGLPSWRRRVAACRFLIERWPEEARDAVHPFPTAHWQLFQFLNAGGELARELLRSNPALGFLAAHAGAANDVGLRRRMLAARVGFPETEHAVHLLRKVPTPWITPEFLAQLRTVMTEEPNVDAVIKHLERINPLALEVIRDPEMHASVARDCIKQLSRVPAPASQCDLIGRMRDLQEYARGHRLPLPRIRKLADLDRPAPLPEAQPADPAPNIAQFPAPTAPHPDRLDHTARVPSAPQRQDRYEFPEPPYPELALEGIRIEAIRTQRELIYESDDMHHCAGRDPSYARAVSLRRFYFYRMIEPERLTIALKREGKYWAIDQVRGVCNQEPDAVSVRLIWNWIHKSLFSSLADERVNSGEDGSLSPAPRVPITLRQPIAAVRRRHHATDQLLFNFEPCRCV